MTKRDEVKWIDKDEYKRLQLKNEKMIKKPIMFPKIQMATTTISGLILIGVFATNIGIVWRGYVFIPLTILLVQCIFLFNDYNKTRLFGKNCDYKIIKILLFILSILMLLVSPLIFLLVVLSGMVDCVGVTGKCGS